MITLVVMAPIFTEVVSGNTPPHAFLRPSVTVFLVAAYSFPLLVMRELSVRWQLSTPGVFVLGLAYGFLNEGLLAQTLIRAEHVPMPNFNHYAYAAGVNFSWVCVIVPWHALLAVLFPLALLAHWFPSCSRERWLGNRAFAILGAALIACVAFIGLVRTPHPQMRAFLLVMAGLIAIASLLRSRRAPQPVAPAGRVFPFVFGVVLYLGIFLVPLILASTRVSLTTFFASVVTLLVFLGLLSRRMGFADVPAAAMVALGSYFTASVFGATAGIARHSLEASLCGGLLAGCFVFLWRANPQSAALSSLSPELERNPAPLRLAIGWPRKRRRLPWASELHFVRFEQNRPADHRFDGRSARQLGIRSPCQQYRR